MPSAWWIILLIAFDAREAALQQMKLKTVFKTGRL
jgi:hypothetical protein